MDQIFTPSLLQVAACRPSEDRQTALTSDLRGGRGKGDSRRVCVCGVGVNAGHSEQREEVNRCDVGDEYPEMTQCPSEL